MPDTAEQPVNPKTIPASTGVVATSSTVSATGGGQFELEQQTYSNTKDIEKLRQDLTNERLNNITIFGIFASLVTFLSVEIQVFKNIDNFWLLIGLSSFLVSSLLLFVFCIHSIARDRLKWKEFFQSPILWIFLIFLAFSFVIFFMNSKGINIDLKVTSP